MYCVALYCIVLHCIALHCTMLCCIVLYRVLFCCVVLYRVVLYCITLYCVVLYCVVQCCIVLYRVVLQCIVLYCIVFSVFCCVLPCCAVLCCIVLYRVVLQCILFYCAVLCYIVLHCIVLCCVVLCCAVLYRTILCCTVSCCVVLCCSAFYRVVLCWCRWGVQLRYVPHKSFTSDWQTDCTACTALTIVIVFRKSAGETLAQDNLNLRISVQKHTRKLSGDYRRHASLLEDDCNEVPHRTALYCTILYYTILYYTLIHYTTSRWTAQCIATLLEHIFALRTSSHRMSVLAVWCISFINEQRKPVLYTPCVCCVVLISTKHKLWLAKKSVSR